MITFFVSATSSAIGYKTLAARLSTMPTNCDFCEFTANDRCSFRQQNLVVYVEIRYMYDKHVGEYSFDFFCIQRKDSWIVILEDNINIPKECTPEWLRKEAFKQRTNTTEWAATSQNQWPSNISKKARRDLSHANWLILWNIWENVKLRSVLNIIS